MWVMTRTFQAAATQEVPQCFKFRVFRGIRCCCGLERAWNGRAHYQHLVTKSCEALVPGAWSKPERPKNVCVAQVIGLIGQRLMFPIKVSVSVPLAIPTSGLLR